MTEVCFFNEQASNCLQHIAVFFEIGAMLLILRDYKLRESDLAKKGRGTALTGMSIPHAKRTKGFIFGLVIGGLAILMESYQLASQYFGC